tara:strand:+ start:2432 stop:2569 length:138 start_codon:yes stop_codon:yes gene_type:complete
MGLKSVPAVGSYFGNPSQQQNGKPEIKRALPPSNTEQIKGEDDNS